MCGTREREVQDTGPPRLGSIAVNYDLLADLDDEGLTRLVGRLHYNGVRELLRAVGKFKRLENEGDVFFAEPSQLPCEIKLRRLRVGLSFPILLTTTWSKMEAMALEFLLDYKDQRAKDKQKVVDGMYTGLIFGVKLILIDRWRCYLRVNG